MNITETQKKILLQYMKVHQDFARGRLRYNGENKKKLDDMWLIISTSLNSVGYGPKKEPKEWQKTWRDWKSAVLKKCAKNRSYASDTGDGPPRILNLTELENDLLSTIDAESAGLTDEAEGGNFEQVLQEIPQKMPKRECDENVPLYESTPLQRNHNSAQSIASGSGIRHDSYSQELEDNSDDNDEADGSTVIVIKNGNAHHIQGKYTAKRKRATHASAAVELMQQQMKIKHEKLRISKEKLAIEKQKLDIMTNISKDLTRIREAVEKIIPSYLE